MIGSRFALSESSASAAARWRIFALAFGLSPFMKIPRDARRR